ncbi:MAG: PA2778 family cysteine peptidase [Desulfatiglandales bacterium]
MYISDEICRKTGGCIFFLFVLSLAVGCVHLSSPDLSSLPEPGLPKRVMIPSVPFYPQETYQCGPAALAMVLNWTDANVSPQELLPQVYTPVRRGSLQPALVSAARRRSRLAYPIRGVDSLLQELAAGHPVIVLQNVALSWFPRWHYAVVIGYDLSEGLVTLHSGKYAKRKINWSLFMRTWKRADHWGLVVLPTTQLPASADEKSYLNAVLGLEQAGQWKGAARAYAAALKRWPHSLGALMGLGNSRYALGDLIGAERVFHRATELYPQSGPAFNNLAHVLAEQGRYLEALKMAHHAVGLGEPNGSLYRQTLHEIETLQLRNR